ncbi:protein HIR1 [Purpureocillium lavendulum]|uniref:Protein HIR1 n=1 Tax=Purpureocillium lavendulum TaxID=1247861 RepID=A0AB34FHQ0_9HYPO|nr:protein HIR1 [Purpureocillium lavendulum]
MSDNKENVEVAPREDTPAAEHAEQPSTPKEATPTPEGTTPKGTPKETPKANGDSKAPAAAKRPGTATSSTTARRPGTASSTGSKTATSATATRTAGGMAKPPTRPPTTTTTTTTARRSTATASTSAASHRSRPSPRADPDRQEDDHGHHHGRGASAHGLVDLGHREPEDLDRRLQNRHVGHPGHANDHRVSLRRNDGYHHGGSSDASAASAKELEDLKSKLAEGTAEIETLKAQIKTSEETISELREQAATTAPAQDADERPAQDGEEAIAALKSEHEAAAAEAELDKLKADLAAAVAAKEAVESELDAVKKSLETIQAENDEKLKASESALQKALEEQSAKIEELQASLTGQHQSAIEDELKSSHETALESANSDKLDLAQIQSDLAAKEAALAEAQEQIKTLDSKSSEAHTALADKDGEISKLRAMHDERMKNLSQDYENEIESLRGDAFFKRKFEELEAQHNELKASSEEAATGSTQALAASKAEHAAAVEALEAREKAHQETLDALRASHAEELESAKTGASADRDAQIGQIETLKTQHAEELKVAKEQSEAALAKELEALQTTHAEVLEALKKEHADEKESATAAHQAELVSAKDAGSGAHVAELEGVRAELAAAKAELEKAQAESLEAVEASKRELQEKHLTEIEKYMNLNSDMVAQMENKGIQARQELEQMAAEHSKSLEDAIAGYRNNNTSLEDKIAQQVEANAGLEKALEDAQEALTKAEAEVEEMGQQLAHEKMERMTALADLDAAKSAKPDTSEADALRQELEALKASHGEASTSTEAALKTKQEELDEAQAKLAAAHETLAGMKDSLELAQKELEAHKAEADAQHKTAQADYKDLNDSMTALVEEANNNAKQMQVALDDTIKRAEDIEKRVNELEAQLKVKEAEVAEAKARAGKPKGLASSRYAETEGGDDEAGANGDEPEGEDADEDHSSAALASLSKARLTAKQIDALDREMRDRNLHSPRPHTYIYTYAAGRGTDTREATATTPDRVHGPRATPRLELTVPDRPPSFPPVDATANNAEYQTMPEVRRGSLHVHSDPALANTGGGGGAGGASSGLGIRTSLSGGRGTDPDGSAAAAAAADDANNGSRKAVPGGGAAASGRDVSFSSDVRPPRLAHLDMPHRSADDVPPRTGTAGITTGPFPGSVTAPTSPIASHSLSNGSAPLPPPSLSYALRDPAPAYYDSRAATRSEWQRRGRTLEEYYDANPQLLPQLPFTWHHGWRRWRLFLFAFLVFVDASALPIALYYGLSYAGHVEGWIIFAVVTTIWGGPTYLEFAIRTLRLIKKERFYRPLGTDSRWCFDMLTWVSVVTITAVTALFVVGSAPHIVWLRVLCMPAPAILYCLGGSLLLITLYHAFRWPAPFRISSTAKGEPVHPGVYYFIEDVVAVNAGAGRPYREALAARYRASPRFRRMLYVQSLFWAIPALILAVPLTVIAVIHPVPATAAYGVCWAVPFLWCALWGAISVRWCKRDMVRERLEWEADTSGVGGGGIGGDGRSAAGAASAEGDAAMRDVKDASPARSDTAGTGGSGSAGGGTA